MSMSSQIKFFSFALTISVFITTPSHANEQASPLSAIYSCAAIIDNTERLACFDKNVPILKVKETKKEIITIDAKQAKAIERDSFGFSLPSLPKFGLIRTDDKTNQAFKVKSLAKTRRGVSVTMENGQVWQQTSGDTGYIPKGDLTAKIKPAAFGSFFLTFANDEGKSAGKSLRVKRIK